MKSKSFKSSFILGLVLMLLLTACGAPKADKSAAGGTSATTPAGETGKAQTAATLKVGYAKSIMSYPMTMLPETTKNLNVELSSFSSGNDVLTALVSKSIDAAQITYLHYITAMSKDFDIVPISGQVNGGTDLLVPKSLNLKENDWDGLKAIIQDYKKQKKSFRVGASRGSAQDIQMRGEFLLHGIDPMKDVQIINIPNFADHVAAIEKGEVDMVTTVEPVASQAKLNGVAAHFAFPYNQAAGNLTNLIVTRSDVIKDRPEDLKEFVGGVVTLMDKLKEDRKVWIDVVNKFTPLDEKTGDEALKNAYPDYRIHRKSALAIVTMMKELNYIQTDVSEKVGNNIDYNFLSQVTGKTKEELGYND